MDQAQKVLWDAVYMPTYEENKEVSQIMRDLPSSYGGTLEALMKWRNFTTDEKFAFAINNSTKTVWRMRKEEDYVPTLKTVVKVCIGLQLPLILCVDIIGKSGASRKLTSNTVKLYALLPAMCCLRLTLEELDEFLKYKGLENLDSDS